MPGVSLMPKFCCQSSSQESWSAKFHGNTLLFRPSRHTSDSQSPRPANSRRRGTWAHRGFTISPFTVPIRSTPFALFPFSTTFSINALLTTGRVYRRRPHWLTLSAADSPLGISRAFVHCFPALSRNSICPASNYAFKRTPGRGCYASDSL